MTAVASLNEELRFFDRLMGRIRRGRRTRFLMNTEEILCKASADKRIEEELRVVEVNPELLDDVVGVRGVRDQSPVKQGGSGVQHGAIRAVGCILAFSPFQSELGFKCLALACCELEFNRMKQLRRHIRRCPCRRW